MNGSHRRKKGEKVLQWYLIFILFLLSAVLYAQKNNIRFKRISTEQELSQVTIHCILQDRRGFMWFGTQDGLNRYDGYEFKIYRHKPGDSTTISDGYVMSIYEDKMGILWIGTHDGGLNKFDPKTESFIHYKHHKDGPNSLSHNDVRAIYEDTSGILWIGTYGGGLNKFDRNTGKFEHCTTRNSGIGNDKIRFIVEDQSGMLWVGTYGGGLNKFNRKTVQFEHYTTHNNNLNHNEITCIIKDKKGNLWIGTNGEGLTKFDPKSKRFTQPGPEKFSVKRISSMYESNTGSIWIGTRGEGLYQFDPKTKRYTHYKNDSRPHSLSNNDILSVYEDKAGVLWVGTYGGGLNKFDRWTQRFTLYTHHADDKNSLSHNEILSLYLDRKDILWIGTNGGGLNRLERNNENVKFKHYKFDNSNLHSLSDNWVRVIYEDRSGVLWVGTQNGGLNKFDRNTQRFTRYQHDPNNPESLSHNDVRVIFEDSYGNFWIGTNGGGLSRLDRKKENFTHYKHDDNNPLSLSHNRVRSMYEDRSGEIWIGTDGGLNKLIDSNKGHFKNFQHDPVKPESMTHNRVRCIYESKNGEFWIGTLGGGVNKFDREKEIFQSFQEEKDGLPNDAVYGFLEDKRGNLWISTNNGLSRFTPKTKTFKNYNVDDGLQSNEFSSMAYCKNERTGEMFFGGMEGFNSFFPENIKDDPYVPPIVITGFFISNKPVPIQRLNPDSPLGKPIYETESLTLTYKQNVFSFEFAALHYASPRRNKYKYKLEGWDNAWIETDSKNRRAAYTNLPAGDYVFRVIGSNKDGKWYEENTSIKLKILPPPWKTWWAYTLYLLAFLTLFFWFLWVQRKKVVHERSIAKQLKQVDKLKDEFLSNTSHELRTPLNGIIGIAESLIDRTAGKPSSEINTNLSMIIASGKRLTNLVNDILDLSRLKNRSLELNKKPVDIRTLADIIITLSRPLIDKKKLELVNNIQEDIPLVEADENRLQQIMHNLVGNAIKFTEAGTVEVTAEVKDDMVYVKVADTGIGIPGERFERIFESFEQIEGSTSRPYGGTGLGLAITKQMVELHGGNIWVESTVGKGSIFTFTLHVTDEQIVEEITPAPPAVLESFGAYKSWKKQIDNIDINKKGDFNMMVVDDEPVNRQVICNILSNQNYTIFEASSGLEALKAIENGYHFDLILLDIMMPQMSGYEVCQKIRERWSQNELPIIFLTAKNQERDLVDAFVSGGSDFISKPVSKAELMARVKTHLQLKNAQIQLIQSERMAVLKTLVAGMSHEINNPTSFSNTSAYNLKKDLEKFKTFINELSGDEMDIEVKSAFDDKFNALFKHVNIIEEGTSRIKGIVNDLKEFSLMGMDKGKMELAKPVKGLKKTLKMVKASYNKKVNFETDFRENPEIECNQVELNQVYMNIMINACQAILEKQKKSEDNSKGTLTIKTLKDEKNVLIVFQDTGIGMSKKVKQQIFEPFFTTKPVGEGTGLGLSIAHGIIEKHEGHIEIELKKGKGTTITLYFPIARQSAETIDRR
jgi:signal transduction histidine kinase/ligand-binding sensor domain-containing protein